MRGLIMSALAAILIAGTQGATCVAQEALPHQVLAGSGIIGTNLNLSESWSEPPQGAVPGGDYQQTCRDIRTNGHTLQAKCQKRDGGWRTSSLDTRNCRSQVINDDGHLRCTQGGGPGYGHPPNQGGGWQGAGPRGDYRLTCQNIRVSGNRLDASCQKADGSWRNTSLQDFGQCGNQISNVDGHLRCGR